MKNLNYTPSVPYYSTHSFLAEIPDCSAHKRWKAALGENNPWLVHGNAAAGTPVHDQTEQWRGNCCPNKSANACLGIRARNKAHYKEERRE